MNQLFQRAATRLTKPTCCVLQIVAGIGGASAAGAALGLNLQALGNVAESAISGFLGGQFLQSTPVLAGMSGTLDLSSVTGQAAAVAMGTFLTIIASVLWPNAEWMVPWGAD